jgi:hypothetical protein
MLSACAETRWTETVMSITATPEARPPQLELFDPWVTRVVAVLLAGGILLAVGVGAAIILNTGA